MRGRKRVGKEIPSIHGGAGDRSSYGGRGRREKSKKKEKTEALLGGERTNTGGRKR